MRENQCLHNCEYFDLIMMWIQFKSLCTEWITMDFIFDILNIWFIWQAVQIYSSWPGTVISEIKGFVMHICITREMGAGFHNAYMWYQACLSWLTVHIDIIFSICYMSKTHEYQHNQCNFKANDIWFVLCPIQAMESSEFAKISVKISNEIHHTKWIASHVIEATSKYRYTAWQLWMQCNLLQSLGFWQ